MEDGWLTRIREAIEADGRSPRAISLAAKAGPNYLGEVLEKGKVPSISKLLAICAQLNVSAAFILTGADVSADGEEMLTLLAKLSPAQRQTLLDLARQLRTTGPVPKART